MEEAKIDLNQIIVIEQLPKIKETLGVISDELDRVINEALTLECTEENKALVKKRRAELNIVKRELELKRKQAKEQIMKPYEEFETIYNELVKDKLEKADTTLKERIETIENEQIFEKASELEQFANEYIEFYGLKGLVSVENLQIKVTLSRSLKSLKDEIKGQLERIANEVQIIKTEEYANEVMVKYLENGFDYPKAKLDVINQHKKMEELDTSIFNEVVVDNYKEVVPKQEEIVEPPKEILEEELIECTFTVNATKEQLIQIKNYLQELGVKYE